MLEASFKSIQLEGSFRNAPEHEVRQVIQGFAISNFFENFSKPSDTLAQSALTCLDPKML